MNTVHHLPPRSVFARMPRGVLALVALLALAAVGLALLSQHGFGMQPCPWCIFQRVLYLALAAVALLGWISKPRGMQTAAALGVLALALGGVASAVFQHKVAALDASCALTLADRFLMATGLETTLPWLFQVTATCMDSAGYRLLGLGYEVWSGALFALLAATALRLLLARR